MQQKCFIQINLDNERCVCSEKLTETIAGLPKTWCIYMNHVLKFDVEDNEW
jgi:hypothetical protein